MALNLDLLTAEEKREMLAILEEKEYRKSRRKLFTYYPDTGPLRRELYPKHLAFFRAGREHRERLMLAANRVGKTEGMGGYETAVHLTGRYPHWWEGRRYDRPIKAWAAGKTNETTRDIIQTKLFGSVSRNGQSKAFSGTGLVPGEDLGSVTWKQGVADLADTIQIKHQSGGWSVLGLKAYQQGRGSFEGTEQDLIWLDEEPPLDVYTEALIRTMTTNGMALLTFTPLEGMSEVVMSFLEDGKMPESDDV
ncbi:MAG: terminase family protein [Gluconobacter cerinus]|uniref:terminase large subunit domain-containing protein n=1 Tax=Gluconobacter cerinus TaxID=38307 RepID=UPI0039E8FA59